MLTTTSGAPDGDGAGPTETSEAPQPSPPEAGRSWRDRLRWRGLTTVLTIVAGILAVGAIVAGLIQLPYATIAPGGTHPVGEAVRINGHPFYDTKGEIIFTTVSVDERVNAYEAFAGWADDDVDVLPERTLRGPVPPEEYRRQSVEAMVDSKTTAEVVTLQHLGYTGEELNAGAEVAFIEPDLPAAQVLQTGDVIVDVDGTPVRTSTDAVNAIRIHQPGDRMTMRVVRGEAAEPRDTEVVLAGGEEGQALLGVRITTKIRLPFEIDIESGDITGPSAGLAYALGLLEVLTPGDLTGGKVVGVTGDLAADGTVGAVGGVAQKTVAVRRTDAELFLVPRANEAEARAHAGDDLEVVAIDNFDDALQALGELRGSNATELRDSERTLRTDAQAPPPPAG